MIVPFTHVPPHNCLLVFGSGTAHAFVCVAFGCAVAPSVGLPWQNKVISIYYEVVGLGQAIIMHVHC